MFVDHILFQTFGLPGVFPFDLHRWMYTPPCCDSHFPRVKHLVTDSGGFRHFSFFFLCQFFVKHDWFFYFGPGRLSKQKIKGQLIQTKIESQPCWPPDQGSTHKEQREFGCSLSGNPRSAPIPDPLPVTDKDLRAKRLPWQLVGCRWFYRQL